MIPKQLLKCALVVPVLFISACADDGDALCESPLSAPSYTLRFAQGLDNFSEDQYVQLRLDSLDVLNTVNAVATRPEAPKESSLLAIKINSFVAAMDDVDWDVSLALSTDEAVKAASRLGTVETLAQANVVDAFVISVCGLPTTLPPLTGPVETLPLPSIPAPTETEPPMSPPDDTSEAREEGRIVASVFGLNLSENQMICLGRALSDIVDVSGANANLAQYQGQFQKAFDECNIDFTVPVE